MDVVINIEPDQEDEMCPRNQQKPQKKRRCSIWFWLCLFIVPVVLIGSGVTAYYLIPRGPDPTPQPPTTSPETSSSTIPPPPEETTILTTRTTTSTTMPTTIPTTSRTTTAMPTTTTVAVIPTKDGTTITEYDQNSWIKDVPITIADETWFVHLFRGENNFESMRFLCDYIGKNSLNEMRGAVYFNKKEEEERFDTIILENANNNTDSVFGTLPHEKRLLWTGCAYEYKNSGNWETECEKDKLKAYNKFCNDDWEQEMDELKKGKEVFYIVKDYREKSKNVCWRFYDSKKLMGIMGANYKNPFLSFACI